MEWYFKWIPLNNPINFQHGTQKKCCLESSGIHFLFRAWIWHDMAIHGFDAHNFLDKNLSTSSNIQPHPGRAPWLACKHSSPRQLVKVKRTRDDFVDAQFT